MRSLYLALNLAAVTVARAQTAVELHGNLSVQGNHIVDKNGATVHFRGMALYRSQWKPAFYNAACVKWLRDDWKINIIRATIIPGAATGITIKPKAIRADQGRIWSVAAMPAFSNGSHAYDLSGQRLPEARPSL